MVFRERLRALFLAVGAAGQPRAPAAAPRPVKPAQEQASPEPQIPTLKRVTDPEALVEILRRVNSKKLQTPDGPIMEGTDYRATAMTADMPGWMQNALSVETVFNSGMNDIMIKNREAWNGHGLIYRPIISPDGEIYHAFTRYEYKSEAGLGKRDRNFVHQASIVFRGPWSPDLLPYATMRLFTKEEHCDTPSSNIAATIEARQQDRKNGIGDMGAASVGDANLKIPSEITNLADIRAKLEEFEPSLEKIPFGPQHAAFSIAEELIKDGLAQSSALISMAFNINPEALKIQPALTGNPKDEELEYDITPQGLSDEALASLTNEQLQEALTPIPYTEYLPGGGREQRHHYRFDLQRISTTAGPSATPITDECHLDAL